MYIDKKYLTIHFIINVIILFFDLLINLVHGNRMKKGCKSIVTRNLFLFMMIIYLLFQSAC